MVSEVIQPGMSPQSFGPTTPYLVLVFQHFVFSFQFYEAARRCWLLLHRYIAVGEHGRGDGESPVARCCPAINWAPMLLHLPCCCMQPTTAMREQHMGGSRGGFESKAEEAGDPPDPSGCRPTTWPSITPQPPAPAPLFFNTHFCQINHRLMPQMQKI